MGSLCRYVDAAHDVEVTGLARRCSVGQLRRILPSVVPAEPAPDPVPDRAPLAGEEGDAGPDPGDTPGRREVTFGNGEDGRWEARVLLPPDEGAVVQRALEASRDFLFRNGDGDTLGWCDALVHMAEAALSNMEGTGRLPGDRFQVIVHVDADHPERARPQDRLGIEGDPTTADGLRFTDHRGRSLRGPSPRPPGAPPPEAADALGLPPPRWDPPLGESLDPKWITWT